MKLATVRHIIKSMADDFAKQHAPIYAALNWKWHREHTVPGVPTAEEIENEICRLADSLTEPGYYSTGGIKVFWESGDTDAPCVGIEFVSSKVYYY